MQGLLDTQRFGAGQELVVEPQRLGVRDLLREACEMFQAAAGTKRIRLVCEASTDLPPIRADEGRLRQVLWNIINNAIRFTPPGGRIEVSGEAMEGEVRFWVRDDGPGTRESDLRHLFDPFWQDKRTARLGAGLGLPISRVLVEAHGGTLSVESRVGVGTTLSFTIPRG